MIGVHDFERNEEVTELVFASASHLRKIRGFQQWTSLHRIELPS
jgi:hypothetical protein